MNRPFDDALARCLRRLDAGWTREQALAAEHDVAQRAALAPLVDAALSMRALDDPPLPKAADARIRAAIAAEEARRDDDRAAALSAVGRDARATPELPVESTPAPEPATPACSRSTPVSCPGVPACRARRSSSTPSRMRLAPPVAGSRCTV